MKKCFFILFLILFGQLLILPESVWSEDLKLISEFEGGKLYKIGPYHLVDLQGTYKQMGRQHGKLLRDQIHQLYNVAVEQVFVKKTGMKIDEIKTVARGISMRYIPKGFRI